MKTINETEKEYLSRVYQFEENIALRTERNIGLCIKYTSRN